MLRILVFIFVPLLIAVVFTAYGLDLFTGGGYGPNFSFLETPSISGTNGVVFTKSMRIWTVPSGGTQPRESCPYYY